MFEIFFGVNMLGALLQFLFASAFLTGGSGDALILVVLRARNGRAESREAQKNNSRRGQTGGTRDSPQAWATRLEGHGAV